MRQLLKAILAHPAVVSLKRPARDAIWKFKAGRVRNPPIPRGVRSILFVCLGNICRSPFAALVASRRLQETGRGGIRCGSAGTRPSQAARSPFEACQAAASFGLSLDDHVPQPVTVDLMRDVDLIVAMDTKQWQQLCATYPDSADRVVLLSLFDTEPRGAYDRYNIADPFGKPRPVFDDCYRRIERAVATLLAAIDK